MSTRGVIASQALSSSSLNALSTRRCSSASTTPLAGPDLKRLAHLQLIRRGVVRRGPSRHQPYQREQRIEQPSEDP